MPEKPKGERVRPQSPPAERSYYYDDAHGYEEFVDSEADESEESAIEEDEGGTAERGDAGNGDKCG